jgi:hypothetical protein
MKFLFLAFTSWLLCLLPTKVLAVSEVGLGLNSSFSGRLVPTLTGAIGNDGLLLAGFASGVQNSYYYQSSYGLAFYRIVRVGELVGGAVSFGGGLGGFYAERGFQDSSQTENYKKKDYVLGPSIRVNWTIVGGFFLNVDATYGLRDLDSHLALNFQDIICTSLGFRL